MNYSLKVSFWDKWVSSGYNIKRIKRTFGNDLFWQPDFQKKRQKLHYNCQAAGCTQWKNLTTTQTQAAPFLSMDLKNKNKRPLFGIHTRITSYILHHWEFVTSEMIACVLHYNSMSSMGIENISRKLRCSGLVCTRKFCHFNYTGIIKKAKPSYCKCSYTGMSASAYPGKSLI